MSRETANAARYAKGMTVLTELEGELLEALEKAKSDISDLLKLPIFDEIWDLSGRRNNTTTEVKMQLAISRAHGE